MLLSNVRNTNLGFSLIEISITLVVVTLLAVIAVPSFIQMRERFEANSAFDQVRGAIKESQLQAIRLSKTCTIKIDTTAKTIAVNNATTDIGCLLSTITLPSSTSVITNSSTKTVGFTFKGHTASGQTIVVSNKSKDYNKCLVISAGIGIMRWGNYTGDLSEPTSAGCKTKDSMTGF